ncbi:MAG: signal recognition particle protein [Clostridia bacterium]|nr:signal recognition particle protein [Clostridia bacterium]MBQ5488691.1 signal recognition particle protein [Clostridia bacterium]
MAFEGLSSKFQNIFKKLGNRGKLTEKEVKEAMREVKLALIEADVNFTIVKQFVNSVSARAVGTEVLESLTPSQQIIKIVNEELTELMGGSVAKLEFGPRKPSIILLAGLQGAGKTTMAGKLAAYLAKTQSKKPLLVACDIYRPAAITQLQVVGEKVNVPVFERGTQNPVKTVEEAIAYAERNLMDVVIIDTAGRLHIDETMMDEIAAIKEFAKPAETLLVVDSMTGQDAVNVAASFNEKLGLTGVILTKLDGDTRGGAALSVRQVTGKPIKFSGIGEKLTDIEPFYPDRMASRILGMGDVLTLIEKAEQAFDEKQALELASKIKNDGFTLEDFLDQFQQMKKMGSMEEILGMMPGVNASQLKDVQVDNKAMGRMEAIIRSMTPKERRKPELLNASRKKRIAAGSGTTVQDVNRLLKQFEQSRQLMKQFTGKGKGKKRRGLLGGLFGGGGFNS